MSESGLRLPRFMSTAKRPARRTVLLEGNGTERRLGVIDRDVGIDEPVTFKHSEPEDHLTSHRDRLLRTNAFRRGPDYRSRHRMKIIEAYALARRKRN